MPRDARSEPAGWFSARSNDTNRQRHDNRARLARSGLTRANRCVPRATHGQAEPMQSRSRIQACRSLTCPGALAGTATIGGGSPPGRRHRCCPRLAAGPANALRQTCRDVLALPGIKSSNRGVRQRRPTAPGALPGAAKARNARQSRRRSGAGAKALPRAPVAQVPRTGSSSHCRRTGGGRTQEPPQASGPLASRSVTRMQALVGAIGAQTPKKKQSPPVRRILCSTSPCRGGHSSRPALARRLKPPTRSLPEQGHRLPIWCCSA